MNTEKQLTHISLIAFAFVAIIVIINLLTTNNYGKANSQVVQTIVNQDNMFNYHNLRALYEGNNSQFQLVDLRNEQNFSQEHLPGAINIPYEQIIDKSSIRKIKKTGKTPVLYADQESKAHTARMLILSKGFKGEIQVMGGSYQTAMEFAIEHFQPAFANYKDEKARFDFNRFMRTGAGSQQARERTTPALIPARVEITGAAGGC